MAGFSLVQIVQLLSRDNEASPCIYLYFSKLPCFFWPSTVIGTKLYCILYEVILYTVWIFILLCTSSADKGVRTKLALQRYFNWGTFLARDWLYRNPCVCVFRFQNSQRGLPSTRERVSWTPARFLVLVNGRFFLSQSPYGSFVTNKNATLRMSIC